jgi:hypothetical protein
MKFTSGYWNTAPYQVRIIFADRTSVTHGFYATMLDATGACFALQQQQQGNIIGLQIYALDKKVREFERTSRRWVSS